MNKATSTLLTAAIVTGLLAAQSAKAEGTQAPTGDQPAAEKNNCNGKQAEQNKPNGKKEEKQGHGKNACKGRNGCSQKDKKAEGK